VRYSPMDWTRRALLELAMRAAALPGAAQFFSAWFQDARAQQHAAMSQAPLQSPFLRDYALQVFSPEDFQALQAFTEILIPTDDTPGAREAQCAHYIDFVLQAASPTVRQQWTDAMTSLKHAGFHSADRQGQLLLVT